MKKKLHIMKPRHITNKFYQSFKPFVISKFDCDLFCALRVINNTNYFIIT